MYPRSGFFVFQGSIRQNHPFGKPLSWQPSNLEDAPEQFKIAICLNHFVLTEVCSVDILVACVLEAYHRFSRGFLQRDASIYESTSVGQAKLLSERVSNF